MMERLTSIATAVAAVGCGLTAGVFLAFSISVMPALRSRPTPEAVATMQQVNIVIVSPIFLTIFLGSAGAAVTAAVGAFVSGGPSRALTSAGALLIVIGCVAVTSVVNVPLNDALAAVQPNSRAGADLWADFSDRWTRWNHVRTAAASVAAMTLTLATRLQIPTGGS